MQNGFYETVPNNVEMKNIANSSIRTKAKSKKYFVLEREGGEDIEEANILSTEEVRKMKEKEGLEFEEDLEKTRGELGLDRGRSLTDTLRSVQKNLLQEEKFDL